MINKATPFGLSGAVFLKLCTLTNILIKIFKILKLYIKIYQDKNL
jgi:hypothetical protein